MTNKKINILIVDDSALVRQTLKSIIETESEFNILAMASDPFIAAEKIKEQIPDVILLDIEMPKMDGLTFLKKIMSQHPIPTIICSTLSEKGSDAAFKAIEYGAVEIIQKPKVGTKNFFEESKVFICDSIKAASKARLKKYNPDKLTVAPKLSADAVIPFSKKHMVENTTEKVIAIGASTGGTEALKTVLESLPLDVPGIVIVQHMPEHFTKSFAKRLDSICKVSVKEAEDGDSIVRGRALIAPGNKHMLVKRSGAKYFVEIKEGPLVSRHRPSVDVLFRSTARYAGKNAVGVIMTGMGDDGAKGLKEMKENGAYTIAQDEKSSVVFGMPKAAISTLAVDSVVSLEQISYKMLQNINRELEV